MTQVPSPSEALLIKKCRDGIRRHLNHLPALFRSFTGMTCRISWAPAWPHQWSERDLPIQFPLCRCLRSSGTGSIACCRRCAARHLKAALRSGHSGHRFTCINGVHNCWHPIILRRKTVGLAFAQALDPRTATPQGGPRDRSARHQAAPGNRPSSTRRACQAARRMRRDEFDRSSKLLQLIFAHAEALTLADLRQEDLGKTQTALSELQTVAAHLREDLNGLIPALNRAPIVVQEESHTEQIVHSMLDYAREHYAHPITLKECARRLNHNTAYLSDLFSRHVGVPFKVYLTDIRLEKARELLGDTNKNISDIASAVGYGSENRFRIAFKHATGLSPKAWRGALRVKPTAPSP